MEDLSEMEWTNEQVLTLIELYRERPVLWNQGLSDFKNKNLKNYAWNEISKEMKISKSEVQSKMRNVITTFQRILKKGKSGSGASSKSKWFAFDHLMFMKDKTTPTFSRDAGINETETQMLEDNNDSVNEQVEELPTQTSRASNSIGETPTASSTCVSNVAQHRPSNKRRRNTMAEEAYSVMKEVGNNLKKKDEFDIFADLVACELRKCSDKKYVALAKRRISDILFDVEMHELNEQSNSNRSTSVSLQDSSSYPASYDGDGFENSPSILKGVGDKAKESAVWGDDFLGSDEHGNTLFRL